MARFFQQQRDVLGLVGKVGIHLDDKISAERQRALKALDISGTQALFFRAMQNVEPAFVCRFFAQRFSDFSRAIRRAVVDDQQVKIRDVEREERRHDARDVLALVVGWQNDNDPWWRRGH